MLSPLIQRPRQRATHRSNERGVTLALVAVTIFSIIAMAALSIDVGTLYQASAEAQRSADAAALAGAQYISTSGLMSDPNDLSNSWTNTCANATQVAQAVANQNLVGGAAPSTTAVTYSASNGASSPGNSDCSGLGAGFAVNPVVTVKVTQASLSTYFARIWGRTGSSVSATATAEAFNPSGSGSYSSSGNVVPVQPRCVKPWIVPNLDPWHPAGLACTTNCNTLVSTADGSITNPGPVASGGVVGETFWLVSECVHGSTPCSFRYTPPQANSVKGTLHGHAQDPPDLDYLAGLTSYSSTAVPSSTTGTCSDLSGDYAQAVAGCDQSTQYQCGKPVSSPNWDVTENPGIADTANGAQCLIHQNGNGPGNGQDSLAGVTTNSSPANYPFQINPGSNNLLGVPTTDVVTSSSSIVSLPIYDNTGAASSVSATGPFNLTIIGFLQVFINYADGNGNVNVTVMNVAGCGNAAPGAPLYGTSPLPVRLITSP